MSTHAGFVIECCDKFLICHSTQAKNGVLTDCSWSITKGKIEDTETPLQAAIREMAEETGIVFESIFSSGYEPQLYKTITVNKTKKCDIFYLKLPDRMIHFPLKCYSSIDNKEHVLYGFPEMDGFMWASKELAHQLVFKSQKELFGD